MWGGRVTEAISYGGGKEHLSILLSSSVGSEEGMLNPLGGRRMEDSASKLPGDSLLGKAILTEEVTHYFFFFF